MSERGQSSASPARPPAMQPAEPAQGYRAVAMGASAGGLQALTIILGELAADFALPILLVQHLHATDDGRFGAHLGASTRLTVVDGGDKAPILPGLVYVAPATYHMLVERDATIALSIDERVNHSRPSIDVLFESAAHAFGARLIAIILSGASHDGAQGMCTIKARGGLTIAQDPISAEHPVMPNAAIEAARIQTVLTPRGIAEKLSELGRSCAEGSHAQAVLVAGERK